MKCEICGKGIPDGVDLFRQNEKGVVGIWRCTEHNTTVVDEEILTIISAIRSQDD